MGKNIFHEHRDDVAKVCKGLLSLERSLPFTTITRQNISDGRIGFLRDIIWMLECDYPGELYECYPEFLEGEDR